MSQDNRLKCSFCGKSQDIVKKLIAGPGVYVCNECVGLCTEILDEEGIDPSSEPDIQNTIFELQGLLPQKHTESLEIVSEELISNALESMESLLRAYEAGPDNVRRKLHSAPFYRTVLHLQERISGSFNEKLIPVLEKLLEIYTIQENYRSSLQALEWIIAIEAKQDPHPNHQSRLKRSLQMSKLYLKLNQSIQAEAIINSIIADDLGDS